MADFDEEAFIQRLLAGGVKPKAAAKIAAKAAASLGQAPLAAVAGPSPGAAKPILKPIKGDLTIGQRNFIEEALQMEQEDAKKANAMGYMARTLAQATLPHTSPELPPGTLYSRDTGLLTLTIAPTSKRHGIPWGSIPRVILGWICTEAVRTQEPELMLGRSQSDFLDKLGMHNNGHDIRRFREQALSLFKAVISVEYANDHDGDQSQRLLISDRSQVFWHPTKTDQASLWANTLTLSKEFFTEITSAPVPLDLDVFHALTKSPMAMDIYVWLVYRMFVLRRSSKPAAHIPWGGLKLQFGAGYPDTPQGLYDFKTNFKKQLRKVLFHYPEAERHLEDDKKAKCLVLTPCELHISQRKTPKLRRA